MNWLARAWALNWVVHVWHHQFRTLVLQFIEGALIVHPTLDTENARKVLDDFRQVLAGYEGQLKDLQIRVEALRRVVQDMDAVLKPEIVRGQEHIVVEPETAAAMTAARNVAVHKGPPWPEVNYPVGIPAVETVLAEARVPLDIDGITDELMRRGWPPRSGSPRTAVRTAVRRLQERNRDLARDAKGRYYLRSNRLAAEPARQESSQRPEVVFSS